jgi:hypothetical protein
LDSQVSAAQSEAETILGYRFLFATSRTATTNAFPGNPKLSSSILLAKNPVLPDTVLSLFRAQYPKSTLFPLSLEIIYIIFQQVIKLS